MDRRKSVRNNCSNKSTTTLKINFELIYFNSASSKCLLDMVILLKKLYSGKLNINWYYEEGDEDLLEAGEEFLML
ncbi:MAG: DUF1987 family protein [Bacteroidales bacterium]|nr:DUF1987 family protein [Bacteroidales bacterium]